MPFKTLYLGTEILTGRLCDQILPQGGRSLLRERLWWREHCRLFTWYENGQPWKPGSCNNASQGASPLERFGTYRCRRVTVAFKDAPGTHIKAAFWCFCQNPRLEKLTANHWSWGSFSVCCQRGKDSILLIWGHLEQHHNWLNSLLWLFISSFFLTHSLSYIPHLCPCCSLCRV